MTEEVLPDTRDDSRPTADDDAPIATVSRRTALKLGSAAALALGGIGTTGTASAHGRSSTDPVVVPFFVVDEAGNTPDEQTPDDTPIYDMRVWTQSGELRPVEAPDGHHVTWGEYSGVSGAVTARCFHGGTYANLRLEGLVPDGLYTIWNVLFRSPGFDGTVASLQETVVGVSPLGPSDGSANVFRASADGAGRVAATTPRRSPVFAPEANEDGRPVVTGFLGDCALDEFEWHVVGAYHLDDQSHGPLPGPAGTEVEQFGFVFRNQDTEG